MAVLVGQLGRAMEDETAGQTLDIGVTIQKELPLEPDPTHEIFGTRCADLESALRELASATTRTDGKLATKISGHSFFAFEASPSTTCGTWRSKRTSSAAFRSHAHVPPSAPVINLEISILTS